MHDNGSKRAGLAFLGAALLLIGTSVATVVYAEGIPQITYTMPRTYAENAERVVVTMEVPVGPGLGLRLPRWTILDFEATGPMEFIVAAQGDGARLLAGQPMQKVHLRVAAGTNTDSRDLWLPRTVGVMDVLWTVSRSNMDSGDAEAIRQHAEGHTHEVYHLDRSWGPALPYFTGVDALLMALTVGAGVRWFRAGRAPAGGPLEGPGTEALLAVVARARSYLDNLHVLLRLVAGLLLLTTAPMLWFMWNGVWAISPGTLHPAYAALPIFGGFLMVYGSAWAVWARYFLNVRREIARFDREMRIPALSL